MDVVSTAALSHIQNCFYASKNTRVANTLEDSKTKDFDSLQSLMRSSKLSTLSAMSTQIEARESSKEYGVLYEYLDEFDNDMHRRTLICSGGSYYVQLNINV